MTSYNDITSARATAASLGLANVAAAADAALTAALLMACLDIDSPGFRYQGRKYDLSQEHEFPRWRDGVAAGSFYGAAAGFLGYSLSSNQFASAVWDWDADASAPVVPELVKVAEVIQAESIMRDASRSERLQAIADGLASQAVGSLSESYRADAKPQPLCERALRMLEKKYRLRSGAML